MAFGRDYREFGAYVALTQELGQHAQVGVRYDFYNPDADSVNTVMGATKPTAFAYQTLSFVAALQAPSGRLIAEYDINRNHNGRDMEGNPTNLADNVFTIRGRGQILMRRAAGLFLMAATARRLRRAPAPSRASPRICSSPARSSSPGRSAPTCGAGAPTVDRWARPFTG